MTIRWLRRLGRTITGRTGDPAVNDELRLHVEMETQDLIARGVAPDAARRQAFIALGGVETFREAARDTRGVRWLDDLGRDIVYTLRSLRRAPGFTFVVVLTLALGIGANATFFSILNTLLLKPLPVRDPASLVMIDGDQWTNPIWEQIRDRQSQILEGAFAWSPAAFDTSTTGQIDAVDGAYVSGGIFNVLGVNALRGRMLSPADDERGGGSDGPVAVISHRLWQQRFGGTDDVVGRSMTVERVPFTIVGVMPRSFFGLDVGRAFDIAIPLGAEARIRGEGSWLDGRSTWWLYIGGRLAPGQTIEQAQAALRAVQPQVREATIPPDFSPSLAAEYLTDPFDFVAADTGRSSLRTRYQPTLVAIMVVVGLVLLIACANVANLTLARATARERELSIRLAVGASRSRVARQLLVECLLLATMGAALGLLIATWGSTLVVSQLTTWRDAVFLDLTPDWRVFGFLVAVTGLTSVVFGLAPVWRIRGASPQDALRDGGRAMAGDRGAGIRNILVVSQVALSLVLLIGAGLFLRTFVVLSRVPTGINAESLVVVDLNLQQSRLPREERGALVERMRDAVSTVPGAVASVSSLVTPLSGQGWNTAVATDKFTGRDRMSWMNAVSPGWFSAVGGSIKEGRDFSGTETPGEVIVNEAFARKFMEPGPVAGQMIASQGPNGPPEPMRVIGLASDVMYRNPREGMVPTIYVVAGRTRAASSLLVRITPGSEGRTTRAIADELRRLDADVAFTFRSFDDLVRATVTQERLTAGLSVAFGALALVLAVVGLYGVMSYSVNRRRSEIAVRMALGADPSTISRLVVGRASALVLTGIVIGSVASWWTSTYVQALLFRLDARDLTTMAGAAIVLGIVGLAAAWIPAWRASLIDPAGLLRED